jgi:hypothetical protein
MHCITTCGNLTEPFALLDARFILCRGQCVGSIKAFLGDMVVRPRSAKEFIDCCTPTNESQPYQSFPVAANVR